MAKIALFYGTQTSYTQTEAEAIQKEFSEDSVVELLDVSKVEVSDFDRFEYIIIGCPTCNVTGKKVACFGPGDQIGYPDSFQDTIGILEEKISEQGGMTVGYWPTAGYEFTESKGIREGQFVGLALDEDNQSDLTGERIKTWAAQLKQEFSV